MLGTNGLSTFSPKQLANIALWLDASNPSNNGAWPANSSALTTWTDLSGLGNNGTQVNNPTFQTNIKNGLPGILFNGTNQTYSIAQTTALDLTGGGTIFVVGQSPASNLWYALSKRVNGGSDFWQAGVQTSSTPSAGVVQWGILSGIVASPGTTISLNTVYLWGYNISAAHTLMYQNGTQVYTDNTDRRPTATQNGLSYVGSVNNVANWWNGYLHEVIAYNTSLTTAQTALVNDYLRRKWAIY